MSELHLPTELGQKRHIRGNSASRSVDIPEQGFSWHMLQAAPKATRAVADEEVVSVPAAPAMDGEEHTGALSQQPVAQSASSADREDLGAPNLDVLAPSAGSAEDQRRVPEAAMPHLPTDQRAEARINRNNYVPSEAATSQRTAVAQIALPEAPLHQAGRAMRHSPPNVPHAQAINHIQQNASLSVDAADHAQLHQKAASALAHPVDKNLRNAPREKDSKLQSAPPGAGPARASWGADSQLMLSAAEHRKLLQRALHTYPHGQPRTVLSAVRGIELGFDGKIEFAGLEPLPRDDVLQTTINQPVGSSTTIHRFSASQPVVPAQVTAQITQAIVTASGDAFELSLSPEELGRVRINVHNAETGLQIVITTERPETLDLLRKNIMLLSRSLSDLGYDGSSFRFEQQNRDDQPPRQAKPIRHETDKAAESPQGISGLRASDLQLRVGMDLRF